MSVGQEAAQCGRQARQILGWWQLSGMIFFPTRSLRIARCISTFIF